MFESSFQCHSEKHEKPTNFISGYQGILLETSSIKLNLHGCLCEAASDYAFIFLEW